MKRYMALIFLLVCIFVLAGCADRGKDITSETTETKTYFKATVLEISDAYLLVKPFEDTLESKSADQIRVSTADIGEALSLNYLAEASVGDIIEIGYHGNIAESYPAQISNIYEIKLITKEAALHDRIPMVMVYGKLYYDTGKESTVTGRCGVMDGEITSTVDGTQIPLEDNQSNFGAGYGYQFGAEGRLEVYMNNKWFVFETRNEEDNTP